MALSTAPRRPCIVRSPLTCTATLLRHIRMRVCPRWCLFLHMAGHMSSTWRRWKYIMFWIRKFQHFAAASTQLCSLLMLPHLSRESYVISQLASLDAKRIDLYGKASKQRWKLRRSWSISSNLSQLHLSYCMHTLSKTLIRSYAFVLSIRLREMGGRVPQSARISTCLANNTKVPRMFDKMNCGIYRRCG